MFSQPATSTSVSLQIIRGDFPRTHFLTGSSLGVSNISCGRLLHSLLHSTEIDPESQTKSSCSFSQLDFLASAQTNYLLRVQALPVSTESNPVSFIIRVSPGLTPPPPSPAPHSRAIYVL